MRYVFRFKRSQYNRGRQAPLEVHLFPLYTVGPYDLAPGQDSLGPLAGTTEAHGRDSLGISARTLEAGAWGGEEMKTTLFSKVSLCWVPEEELGCGDRVAFLSAGGEQGCGRKKLALSRPIQRSPSGGSGRMQ